MGAGEDKGLKRRIRQGQIQKNDIARCLAELAFGRANDCVRLALEEDADIDKLDLSLLSEIRRSSQGVVEVKLMDRLKILEQLAELTGGEKDDLREFLLAMGGGGEA